MRVGDAIQCWSHKEMVKKMMELASRGIIADEEPKDSNRLVIKRIEGEEDE